MCCGEGVQARTPAVRQEQLRKCRHVTKGNVFSNLIGLKLTLVLGAHTPPSAERLLIEALCRLQYLLNPGSDHVVLGEVDPTNDARRVDQELGGSRDVVSIGTRTWMYDVELSDCFKVWIGKKWKRVTGLLYQRP